MLGCNIESKRREMIEASNRYGLCANVTIKISQELDELLNQYYRMMTQPKEMYVETSK
ncbi:aspartyl-phosphate phosphatase Spo0E family protein [Anaerobacillus alkaliphilus]|uniref:Aspartyl-phosphate phosphatase Spo0E family protein n=2 Tax=Anaerobacillus alkaliphilus TaxID=1548597 RepID=A0A4V1LGF4_9BACI|nr:aspartyl-phosphate phosphatase Spo0E family protein [Anaerobacillus alkaliphilus]